MMKVCFHLLLLALIIPAITAQTLDCPVLAQTALALTAESCSVIGRNQACYGHALLNATPRPTAQDFTFQRAGDIVNIAQIERLQLTAMSLTDETWGVALLKAQANLPDTLPGQNVTIVLFGDVWVENSGDIVARVTMTASTGVNVRRTPRVDAQNVLDSLARGEAVTASGRLADGSWILVQLDNGISGWVAADFLTGEAERLAIVAAEETMVYGPMQAFILRSGVGDSACSEAPASGILVQTPSGTGEIRLLVNGVEIQLGSTIYLQAEAYLYITVLEGKATVRAEGVTQVVPSRTQTRVPLGTDGLAAGSPEYPQPYRWVDIRALPVVLLEEPINLRRPLRSQDVETAVLAAGGVPRISAAPSISAAAPTTADGQLVGNLLSGRWRVTTTVLANTCDPNRIPVGKVTSGHIVQVTFAADGSSVLAHIAPDWIYVLYRIGDNVYQGSLSPDREGSSEIITMTLTSSTSYLITYRAVAGDPNNGGCIFDQDEVGVYVGP